VPEPDAKPKRPSKTATRRAALAYFERINARDLDGAVACWAEGAQESIHGQREVIARDGLFAFLGELMGAFPDLRFDVEETVCDGDCCVVRSTLRGTFAGPGAWAGVEPNGERLEVPVIDCLVVRDGLIVGNDAYADGMTIARQMGLLPAQDSSAEQRLTRLANARTRAADRLLGTDVGQVAEGVWRVQGAPARCNVYLVREHDGVLMFDAGARVMTRAVAQAAARLGGLTRIVLGHGHTDHRGTAPAFGVPVLCHPDEVADAQGSGGFRYWGDLEQLGWRRPLFRVLHERFWDGGPVSIAGTVAEGDEIAGFRVVHLPGHAPGLIALLREEDRLALTSDAFYTLDEWGRPCEPRLPSPVWNLDSEQARASLRKLAALEPAACWPGHGGAVTGTEVRARLERAAGAPA